MSAELRVIAQVYVPLSLKCPISIGRNSNELTRLLPEGGTTARLALPTGIVIPLGSIHTTLAITGVFTIVVFTVAVQIRR